MQVKLQRGVRQTVPKTFECPQCGLTFDRASQLGYHYRSIHLGERSQVCQICGKGFFRKADLRTHLNIHLGTNVCICEICGRRFNHISNLIRHCRVHAGVKPYLCSICDRRFTQVSSLVRHKRIIHGIPKETIRQYCSPINNLTGNEPQTDALREGKTISSNVESKYERVHVESECQNSSRKVDTQKDKIISDLHNTDTDSKSTVACLPLETIVYVTSKQLEESNLTEIESINQLSQDYLAGIEEKLESVDLSTNEAVVPSPRDTVNNHEEIQSKDNIIYLHQLDRNSFTFLPRDRGPTAELQDVESTLRSSDLETRAIQDFKEASVRNDARSSMAVNSEICNSSEIQVDQKYLHKQTCKEITGENKKCDKSLNDDNQLYIELSDLGLLKFDESRYCSNTDSVNMNLSYAMKSANITANDLICTPITTQSQDDLVHNEENLESLNNPSNVALNNEEPTLRLVQTENGEQFYEFIISDLMEKMQSASSAKNLENKTEEAPSSFRPNTCQRMDLNLRENENNQTTRHQQALEDLADINNEFNYAHFDFHREEKNLAVLYHNESEHFQQDSTDNECTNGIQEKNIHAYNSGNLELLENESHVDFDKYVETNLEVFERLNYENCTEKLLEFVEVADISVESSGYKEPSMVCLIQNDGEQLLELLQDSQITEQEPNQTFVTANEFNNDCSNVLQDNIKIADCPESKSEFFTYIENSVSLGNNTKNDRSITQDKGGCADNGNHLYTNPENNEDNAGNETNVKTTEQLKKPKTSPKKFQCSVCKKAFSTAYNYKQHIGIHFTDQQKFHCKECGVSFAWKSTLNKHVANNHSSDGPQKFICEICPRVYSTLSQVNEHVKRDHLKQRNHVCLHCGKSFFKSFDLKTHSRTHTNERPYVCRVCGKRFHHQSHIIRHERTHSGERPYSCDVCQKTFTQPSSLKAHKQKHQQIRMDILDYQIDEDDPITLATL